MKSLSLSILAKQITDNPLYAKMVNLIIVPLRERNCYNKVVLFYASKEY